LKKNKNLAETKDKLLRLVTTENNMIKINEYAKIVISSLSKKLDDNHPRIRAKAAFALAKIGTETAIPGLLKALEDSNEFVRWNAAFALGEIGLEEAIPALINALSDAEDNVRFSAADAIGKIGSRYALT
jgi:HEAT repeat protein